MWQRSHRFISSHLCNDVIEVGSIGISNAFQGAWLSRGHGLPDLLGPKDATDDEHDLARPLVHPVDTFAGRVCLYGLGADMVEGLQHRRFDLHSSTQLNADMVSQPKGSSCCAKSSTLLVTSRYSYYH